MNSMFPKQSFKPLLSWQCSWESPEQQHFQDDIHFFRFLSCYVSDSASVDSVPRTLFSMIVCLEKTFLIQCVK